MPLRVIERILNHLAGRLNVLYSDADHDLHLGNFIHGIDVIEPLDAVQIALMDGVDAQEAGTACRPGFAPFANGDGGGAGFRVMMALALIAGTVAQVVEMAGGDPRQALESRVVEDMISPLTEFAGGGTREGAVQGIHLDQQGDIGGLIIPRKGIGRFTALVADVTGLAIPGNQPCHLGTREAADLLEVLLHRPFVSLPQLDVMQLTQGGFNPGIGVFTGRDLEIQGEGTGQKGPDLLQTLESLGM